jgi:hypothetical protein
MAYVYDRVAKDRHSRQSPHFGFLDGDGDLIFSAPQLGRLNEIAEKDEDLLIQMPTLSLQQNLPNSTLTAGEMMKDYLSDPKARIRLQDFVASQLRVTLGLLSDKNFPLNQKVDADELARRLHSYEEAISGLQESIILIARWGEAAHLPSLETIVARLADPIQTQSGQLACLSLRWYPIVNLLYSGGIAALVGNNYAALAALLLSRLHGRETASESRVAVSRAVAGFYEIAWDGALFRSLPGHERQYTPVSEYLFKQLQPALEDALFLGNSYEEFFDRFEILLCLVYADIERRAGRNAWGPVGRFGWKRSRIAGNGVFDELIGEAEVAGAGWPPLQAGLFEGSIDNFKATVHEFCEGVLNRLRWR